MTRSVYDARNRIKEEIDGNGDVFKTYVFDSNSNQIAATDSKGNTLRFVYDWDNRLVKTIDRLGYTELTAYDSLGNVIAKTDRNGNQTRYEYDGLNHMTKVVDPLGQVTRYVYDTKGNVLKQIDALSHETIYEYNAIGSVARVITHGGREEEDGVYYYDPTKVTQFTYYANGLQKTMKDRQGNVTNYRYDVYGNMIEKTIGEEKETYIYDALGNLLSSTSSDGITVSRSYDELNRVIIKNAEGVGVVRFDYETTVSGVLNHVETTLDADGETTVKTYNALGQLASVRTKDGTTTYAYDGNGNETSITYPNGRQSLYSFDVEDRMVGVDNRRYLSGAYVTTDTYTYTFDRDGNQISEIQNKSGKEPISTYYTYDSLNRLIGVTESLGTSTLYQYDGAGNRIYEKYVDSDGATITNYTYDANNLLIHTDKETERGKETTRYNYDYNGNLISKMNERIEEYDIVEEPQADFGLFISGQEEDAYTEHAQEMYESTVYYGYDVFNRLTRATQGASSTDYGYNAEGLRAYESSPTKTAYYLYEGSRVTQETDAYGNVTAKNIYGNSLISRSTVDETQFYLYNGRGDVVELSDASSVTIAQYTYDAFGNLLREGDEPDSDTQENEGVDNPYRYKGYRYDESTGLYNLNGRLYDPEIARFTQEDNYYGKVNEPLSLNRYTYTYNNPIRYWDPTGHVVSAWDRNHLTDSEISELEAYTDQYEDAMKSQKNAHSASAWQAMEELKKSIHEKASTLRNKYLNDDEAVKQDGNVVSISKNRDSGYKSGAQRETTSRSETTSGSSSSSTSTNTVEKNTTTVDEDTVQKNTSDDQGTSEDVSVIKKIYYWFKGSGENQSVVYSFTPVLSDGKDIQELIIPYDFAADRLLTVDEALTGIVAAAIPVVGRKGISDGMHVVASKTDEVVTGFIKGTVKALDDIPMSRLDYHFNKHKDEFIDLYGNLSKDGYLNKAREFVTQEASDSVEMFYRGNGDKVIFNKTTQEFGVQTKDGLIKTYFIPDPSVHGYKTNYDYFKAQ